MTSTSSTVDAAAQFCIGAAARELHLPTVRSEAVRLAEIALRERQSHLGYLAEVLAAEVDDRSERRRTRRINEAHFPCIKRLADFKVDQVPGLQPAQLATLASRHFENAPLGRASVLCQGSPQRGDRSFWVVGPISWERHQPSTSAARQQRA